MPTALRSISDTAFLTAAHRALETERPGALFRDPLARRLAGARGDLVEKTLAGGMADHWAWAVRTYLFDQIVLDQVAQGTDAVLNLAAGLDARPYRMPLPARLRWIEVDLPDVLSYKSEILAGERPACRLERIDVDLGDAAARRRLLADVSRSAARVLVITEGLTIYLSAEDVATLARDLAAAASVQHWAVDVVSPGLLRMMQQRIGTALKAANAALQFAPPEGPAFFEPHGWRPAEVHSLLKTAARVMRLPWRLRLVARLPDRSGPNRIWSGVCLLERR